MVLTCIQAFKQSNKVHVAIQGEMEKLIDHFDDIEDYLGIYSDEDKVVSRALNLNMSMLKAVEDMIEFYTKNIGRPSN